MKIRLLVTAGAALLFSLTVQAAEPGPEIRTDDVARFYAVYDSAQGKPTAQQLQQEYLARASPGLVEFTKLRRITGERIAAAIAERPAVFAEARQCVAVLPAVKTRVAA